MDESSSDCSHADEDVFRNFEEEAKIIVDSETLPKKTSDRYLLVYNTYKKWQEDHKNSLSNSDEKNLTAYFDTLKEKVKPPTLWSIWSMLRKTLSEIDNIDISHFFKLKKMIKNNSKGYKPKKSVPLKWSEITTFMTEASDHTYLAVKVILIFGICGALRCGEIISIKFKDVEDLDDTFLVSVRYKKSKNPGQFVIGNLFYDKVKKYISLRPTDQSSDRFFIQYHNGRCTRQPIGKHKIGEVPESIALYLKLQNTEMYTGHCFRKTAATLLSEPDANMYMIKQLGRCRSDILENSIHKKQLVYENITQGSVVIKTYSNPKLKNAEVTTACKEAESDNTEDKEAESDNTEDKEAESDNTEDKEAESDNTEDKGAESIKNLDPIPSKYQKYFVNLYE